MFATAPGGWPSRPSQVHCEPRVSAAPWRFRQRRRHRGDQPQRARSADRRSLVEGEIDRARYRRSCLHFGLGPEKSADIEIHWPSGIVERISAVASDRLVTIRESAGIVRTDRF
jgi:hypothetical protein